MTQAVAQVAQKLQIGDLIVGDQLRYAGETYQVKRFDRDGMPWPALRYAYIGPPGNDGEECRFNCFKEIEPVAPVIVRGGLLYLGDRLLDGQ